MKQKIVISILCLAVLSLACLGTTSAIVLDPEIATAAATETMTATATAEAVLISPTRTAVPQICARVTADRAENLRALPSARARILAHLRSGEVVQVFDQGNVDWWRIERGDDVGYARSIYLQIADCEVSNEH